MVTVFLYLLRLSRATVLASILASLLCAVLNVFLVQMTVNAIRPGSEGHRSNLSFWACSGMLLVAYNLSEIALTRMSQRNAYKLRVRLSRRVAAMNQESIEAMGAATIMSVVAEDIGQVSSLSGTFPLLAMNLMIVLGTFAYLWYVSPIVFMLIGITALTAVCVFKVIERRSLALFALARAAQEAVLSDFIALVSGSKELRLDSAKRTSTLSDLENHAACSNRGQYKALRTHAFAESLVVASYFIAIGLLISLPSQSHFGIDRRSALAAIMGILFMKGSAEGIVTFFPNMRKAEVALSHIADLGFQLNAETTAPEQVSKANWGSFRCIRLSGVSFQYEARNGGCPFRIGPISLDIPRGQMVFLVGGNGSGKTSLLKILCGLYAPDQGFLSLDEERVTEEHTAEYRELFSAVFQDFYLFKTFPSRGEASSVTRAESYLHEFGLFGRVKATRTGFVCDDLSRGQQKRLALILALLEDKPICLLDEWAADQDAEFKRYFYTQILPRMKKEGKTIVAITHDDLYYHVADRVVVLRDGLLVNEQLRYSEGQTERVAAL